MAIDPDFSVYELIEKQSPSNIQLANISYMRHFSRVIEREVIKHQLQCTIYVGIQSTSNLLSLLNGFQQMGQIAEQMYVFGVTDTPISQTSFNLVSLLPDSKLSREWFIIVNHAEYARILSGREIISADDKVSDRTFQAILSSDLSVIDFVATALSELVISNAQVKC